MILVILLHVDLIRNVSMEFVHVYLNTKETHTRAVDQNVLQTMSVPVINLAPEISVLTHALEHVDKMLCAILSIIFQCVHVLRVWLEMHSHNVFRNNVCIFPIPILQVLRTLSFFQLSTY